MGWPLLRDHCTAAGNELVRLQYRKCAVPCRRSPLAGVCAHVRRMAARDYARGMTYKGASGYLVNINSADESAALAPHLQGGAWYWIGGSDLAGTGKWTWDRTNQQFWQGTTRAGGPMPGIYQNFAPGEPNNGGNMEHCAHIITRPGLPWNDLVCTQTLWFIVEFSCKHSLVRLVRFVRFSVGCALSLYIVLPLALCRVALLSRFLWVYCVYSLFFFPPLYPPVARACLCVSVCVYVYLCACVCCVSYFPAQFSVTPTTVAATR